MERTVLGIVIVIGITGCLERPGGTQADWDVRGNYDLTYGTQIDLKLNIAGAIREATATGYGQVVSFGMHEGNPLTLDLTAHCEKPEVVCPDESFWDKVAIDQVQPTRNLALHSLTVINDTVHEPPAGEDAEARGGIVNNDRNQRFLVGLGLAGGAQGVCGAVAASVAVGRFTHAGESIETSTVFRDESGQPCEPGTGDGGTSDAGTVDDGGVDGATGGECLEVLAESLTWPEGATVDGIEDGRVIMAWAGGCAFGPVLVGATLSMQVRFDGVRTGDYDPPLGIELVTVEGEVPPDEPVVAEGG